jgi:type II secretory pathway component PulL
MAKGFDALVARVFANDTPERAAKRRADIEKRTQRILSRLTRSNTMSTKTKPADAVLKVSGADEMTPEKRREVAQWLRRQADSLEREGEKYDGKFTARLYQ